MSIVEAKKHWAGTVGLSSASQVINGTLSQSMRPMNLGTPVHPAVFKIMRLEVQPSFKTSEQPAFKPTRTVPPVQKKRGKHLKTR